MNPFPIADRELRVAARKKNTYAARVLATIWSASLAIAMMYSGFTNRVNPASVGRDYFIMLTILGYVMALVNGALITADSLSREKREGTLGLLFLTDLRGFDIVAGKIMAQPWNAFYCLVATFPALAFGFLLGGVSGAEFFQMALALTNALFFSASAGIVISTLIQQELAAISLTMTSVMLLGVILPLGSFLPFFSQQPLLGPELLFISPAGAGMALLYPKTAGSLAPETLYWGSLITSHLMGWCCLFFSAVVLPGFVREKGSGEARRWLFFTRQASKEKIPVSGPAPKTGQADPWWEINPVFLTGMRLAARGASPTRRFTVVALLFLGVLWFCPELWSRPIGWSGVSDFPPGWFNPPVFPLGIVAIHYLLKFGLTAEACVALNQERRNGTLELVLTTPLGEDQVIHGWMLILKRRFFIPTLIVMGLDTVLLLTGLPLLNLACQMGLIGLYLVLAGTLIVDLYALAWIGLWRGLTASETSRAIRQTILNVMVTPWLVTLATIAVVAILLHGVNAHPLVSACCFLTVVGGFYTLTIGQVGSAINDLRDDLRKLASQAALSSSVKM